MASFTVTSFSSSFVVQTAGVRPAQRGDRDTGSSAPADAELVLDVGDLPVELTHLVGQLLALGAQTLDPR